ncbi:MAG: hypothetical protein ACI91V_000389, partial [Lentimonas sp.]
FVRQFPVIVGQFHPTSVERILPKKVGHQLPSVVEA